MHRTAEATALREMFFCANIILRFGCNRKLWYNLDGDGEKPLLGRSRAHLQLFMYVARYVGWSERPRHDQEHHFDLMGQHASYTSYYFFQPILVINKGR